MKKIVFVLLVIGLAFMPFNAMALLDNDHSVDVDVDVTAKVNLDNTNVNKVDNTNVNKVDNRDVNINDNKDVNINDNKDVNVNDNKDVNVNKVGQSVTLNQNYEAKRDHIVGPGLMNTDTKLARTKPFNALTKGSIWNKIQGGLPYEYAKTIINDSGLWDDIEVKTVVMVKGKFTNFMNKDKSGEYMGYVVVMPTGTDVTVGAMEAKAAMAGMKVGATHMEMIHFGTGEYSDGDSWNIGIGGGASMMANGDKTAIAPNGGTGIGGANATNYMLPEMVFELYRDKRFVKPLK